MSQNTDGFELESRIKQAADESSDVIGCSNFDAAQAAQYMREAWTDFLDQKAVDEPVEPMTARVVMDGLAAPDDVSLSIVILTDDDLVDDVMDILNDELNPNISITH